jgi:hypothetical protein
MVAWIEQYGQIIGFFIQLVFYIVVAYSAAWAAVTFARYVKFMTSDEVVVEDDAVSVEEFVE